MWLLVILLLCQMFTGAEEFTLMLQCLRFGQIGIANLAFDRIGAGTGRFYGGRFSPASQVTPYYNVEAPQGEENQY
ncbi:hypothetical protein AAY24_09320 [Sedimenticola thiotaurini]|uniref:Uncharacterized protein n=1 Tax=Sedimenticola thiotaurini TaxID=1543721 RepID=A0A0F7JVD2_9GAMM|nr:hypothetical protein AAY24_09320 [Sedimenticola thiotaurini]